MPSTEPTTEPTTQQPPRAVVRAAAHSAGSHRVRSIAACIAWLGLSLAIIGILAATAVGQQQYQEVPFAEAYKLIDPNGDATNSSRRANRTVYSAIKDATDTAVNGLESGDATAAAKFFKEYTLPAMTRTSDQSLSTLGQQREDFIDDFLSDDVAGAGRLAFINNTVIPAMQKLAAADQVHPASRINAVYVLGLLDQVAGDRNTAPTPSPEAFRSLITILKTERLPESLKVAATAGIERFLKLARAGGGALDGNDINNATTSALAILSDKAAGQADWNQDLNYWLKKRSVKILSTIGQAGANGEVVQTMLNVLSAEGDDDLWLKHEAMLALQNIDLTTIDQALISKATVAVVQFLSRGMELKSLDAQSRLDALIFNNLLLEDLDLEIKGNDYSEQKKTSSKTASQQRKRQPKNQRGGGGMDMGMDMGGMGMEMGGMEMDMGGMGMDMGGMGMDGGRGGGGGAARNRRPGAPQVELPNYELHLIRTQIKTLAYGGRQTLAAFQKVASEQDKQIIEETVQELNNAIEASNVGIVNLSEPPPEDEDLEEDPPSNTEQMIELASQASSRLSGIIRRLGGGAGDAPAGGDNPGFENANAGTPDQPAFN